MTHGPRTPEVLTSRGESIVLGAELGSGAEGIVYAVKNDATKAAKIYIKPIKQERAEKILAMTRMQAAQLKKVASWPSDLLLDKKSKQPVGLLIPRIRDKKNVHHLYGPKSRIQDFPRADWRVLVRAAANIAISFEEVHAAGCVIGDVNHGSIMVGSDATASLVDCESFQVVTEGRKFLCEVGIETYSPPEVQGVASFRVDRTPNFDNFGLAVMIFHLLFMGRHPFAGKFNGPANMPIPEAIKECRFPYSANHKAMQMDRPPGTPALSYVGAEVAHLFERAFSRETVGGGRPTARQWAAALKVLEDNAAQCNASKGHWHPRHLSVCPWCTMEAQGASPLFPFVMPLPPGGGPTLDVDALWRQIQNLPDLGSVPAIPQSVKQPSIAATKAGKPSVSAKPVATTVGWAIFLGGTFAFPPLFWVFGGLGIVAYNFLIGQLSNDGRVVPFRIALADAERDFTRANAEWQRRASAVTFHQARDRFEARRTEIAALPAQRAKALEQLRHDHRRLQLDRFLDKFEIEDAKIDGIGPGRKGTLASYGIETAEDLVSQRIVSIPGFGPVMIERLMKWRRTVEGTFVFDPTRAIDPRDIIKVEQHFLTLRLQTESAARTALAETMQAHAQITAARKFGRSHMEALQCAIDQARADLRYVGG